MATMAVDKQDIERLHDKVDRIQIEVTEIKTTLKVTPIPKQPCEFFKAHEKKHEDDMTLWKRPIVSSIVHIVEMGIVFIIAFFWGKSK